MTTRQQRRQAERQKNKGQATLRQYPEGKTEIYIYKDDTGKEQWLDVVGLRAWANAHMQSIRIGIDLKRVSEIVKADAIDVDHFMSHTLPNPENALPILICNELLKGVDEIVDGNHTYVAFGMAMAMAQREGIPMPVPPSAEGYMIEPEIWKRFVVPLEMRGTTMGRE